MVTKTIQYKHCPTTLVTNNKVVDNNNDLMTNGCLISEQLSKSGYVLNERQMYFLRHKPYLYNCYVDSVLENLFLQKFWYKISQYVPKNIAPCSITCAGLAINVITSAILFYYSPDAKQIVPNWAFLMCAFGLFIYQLFDALDGKQAVKVQDTPIEEVYDHGCDAVSAVMVTQAITVASQLGTTPGLQFIFFIIPLIAFYMTHYCCHITRVMVFGKIDVIEGQWAMIAVHTLTYIYGQQMFEWTLFGNITLKHVLWLLTILAISSSIVNNLRLILGADSPMDRYVRIPRKYNLSRHNPSVSLLILTVSAIMAFERQVFHENPILFITCFGLAFAKLSFKLQMMNVTHGVMPKVDSSVIAPIIVIINAYSQLVSYNFILWTALVYELLDYSLYFVMSSLDMKTALDVNIFSLKYPPSHPKCRNKNYGFNLNGTENQTALKNITKYSQLIDDVYSY
ncbi:cholinephosphotransferase 1-like [Oppia nitens]|uniref:cholinephosphotransferase 1-like n=1 Tax=Oppia nitens TaxID=1686743 RepID=UPI0023DA88F6|nr:cholinephosphotransferase 1-like [Oppia nitens]